MQFDIANLLRNIVLLIEIDFKSNAYMYFFSNYHRKKVVNSITESREKLQVIYQWQWSNKKNHKMLLFYLLLSIKKSKKESSNFIKVPDFSDTKSNSYWRFSFIDELVVEIAREDPNEPVEYVKTPLIIYSYKSF